MIDTHSHLDGEEFREDFNDVIARAKEAGIEKIFIPGICLKDTPRILELCTAHKGYLYPMIGLHPENVMDEDYHIALKGLEEILVMSLEPDNGIPTPVAIGEVGLDLYWDSTYKEQQIEAFDIQIGWAEKYNLPLMIHARNAHRELVEVIGRHDTSRLKGVFHCFSGNHDEAKELLGFEGFMLGIGGVCTFKKSTLPEVIRDCVPLDRIVLETDSPYLAPVPHRGKRNESAYIPCIADKLSEIFGADVRDIKHQTTENVHKVFSI